LNKRELCKEKNLYFSFNDGSHGKNIYQAGLSSLRSSAGGGEKWNDGILGPICISIQTENIT